MRKCAYLGFWSILVQLFIWIHYHYLMMWYTEVFLSLICCSMECKCHKYFYNWNFQGIACIMWLFHFYKGEVNIDINCLWVRSYLYIRSKFSKSKSHNSKNIRIDIIAQYIHIHIDSRLLEKLMERDIEHN